MTSSRRKFMAAGGSLLSTLFGGCLTHIPNHPRLTLRINNFDDGKHWVRVEFYRENQNERSEAIAFDREFELQARPEDRPTYTLKKQNVVKSQPYIVRVSLIDLPAIREEYRFYPDCDESGESSEALYINIKEEEYNQHPSILFDQNVCSENSWWY